MNKKKILIVDVEMEGTYVVDQAFNGAEGVEKYKKFIPDLVIMDINMPIMDGYESSLQIKAFDPSARILVLTGNASDSRAKKTIQEGIALTLLQKPLRLEELSRIIRDNLYYS
ncbi:MAG: response regulator [Deltaproteobacteria bacterium]|nr:response regulator [Deltaproteobacteria bacterium]